MMMTLSGYVFWNIFHSFENNWYVYDTSCMIKHRWLVVNFNFVIAWDLLLQLNLNLEMIIRVRLDSIQLKFYDNITFYSRFIELLAIKSLQLSFDDGFLLLEKMVEFN